MSFLAIRSKWKAKSKAVSRRLAQAPTAGNTREQPPASALSTESFESPFVVEIGGSPNPDRSPQVDLELNTDPLFPSGIFARPGSVSSGSQKHLYNPWAARSRNGVEETVVVASEDGAEQASGILLQMAYMNAHALQDDPHAWVDEVRRFADLYGDSIAEASETARTGKGTLFLDEEGGTDAACHPKRAFAARLPTRWPTVCAR